MALDGPVLCDPVRAMPFPKEFFGIRMQSLPNRLELFWLDLAFEAQLFRSVAVPLAFDALAFCVIIVLFQVPSCVSDCSGHCSNGEHVSTVSAVSDLHHQRKAQFLGRHHP